MALDSGVGPPPNDPTIIARDVFARQLQQWTRSRAPRWIHAAMTVTRSAALDDTRRIFLDSGGLVAWLAYSLATQGEAHFAGRRQQHDIIRKFTTLPLGNRVGTARYLARISLSPEVVKAITLIRRKLEDEGRQSHDKLVFLSNYLGRSP